VTTSRIDSDSQGLTLRLDRVSPRAPIPARAEPTAELPEKLRTLRASLGIAAIRRIDWIKWSDRITYELQGVL